MLSEVNQRKTNTICFHLYVESKKLNNGIYITKQKQTHRYREQTWLLWGEEWDEGQDRRMGIERYKLICIK